MAKLITTKAEKAAASFLDWDDAALGKMCKKMAVLIQGRRRKQLAKGKADDDIGAVINAADGLLLIGSIVEMNAGMMALKFGDFTHAGEPQGDWEIKIRQLSKPRKV